MPRGASPGDVGSPSPPPRGGLQLAPARAAPSPTANRSRIGTVRRASDGTFSRPSSVEAELPLRDGQHRDAQPAVGRGAQDRLGA